MNQEFSSPACFSADADDVYMGYASPEELATTLNVIRAKQQRAMDMLQCEISSRAHTELSHQKALLLRELYDTQAVLLDTIERLGTRPEPSSRPQPDGEAVSSQEASGALPSVISDLLESIARLLPRVRNDLLHEKLANIYRRLQPFIPSDG